MSRFTLPRDLYHGKGSLEELKNLKGKKAILVVGGGSMKRFGFLDRAVNYLKEAGMEVMLFENVEPDPSVETVMKGAKVMQEFCPDWIVSMGGGSPIDAAKAMWAFYEYPDTTFEELTIPFNFPALRTKAKFCAIPSTSGTATEVTAFSVITDYAKGIKYPLALHAIKMIHNDLKKSYDGDMEARARMHDAQCLTGMAFSNALLGIVHSMAHKTGAAYTGGHIVHGCANAMYLPKVIQYNAKNKEACTRYAEIATFMGLTGGSDEELKDALVAELKAMNASLSIPDAIKDYEDGIIDEKEFLEKLPQIAKLAISDACTGSNPRTPVSEEMEKLLKACYYGEDVTF